jgi:hypothetical protein
MRKHFLKANYKWFVLLLVSTLVLIWRLIDFSYDSVNGFAMTRGGFVLKGAGAAIIELVIILGCIVFIWLVITNIVRLYLSKPSG